MLARYNLLKRDHILYLYSVDATNTRDFFNVDNYIIYLYCMFFFW
jgi:hypothetical protein